MFLLYIYFVINYLLVYLISVDTPGFRPVRIRTGRPTCEDPDNYDVDHEFPEVSITFVLLYWLFVRYDLGLVLLAILKNWNESVSEVVPSIYQNTGWEFHCADMVSI